MNTQSAEDPAHGSSSPCTGGDSSPDDIARTHVGAEPGCVVADAEQQNDGHVDHTIPLYVSPRVRRFLQTVAVSDANSDGKSLSKEAYENVVHTLIQSCQTLEEQMELLTSYETCTQQLLKLAPLAEAEVELKSVLEIEKQLQLELAELQALESGAATVDRLAKVPRLSAT